MEKEIEINEDVKAEELKDVSGGKLIKDGDGFIREDDKKDTEFGRFSSLEEALFHEKGVGTCPYCGKKLS